MNIERIAELRHGIGERKRDLPALSSVPVAGQIHRLRECTPDSPLFFLVAACYGEYCNVIPGSFDGMHAVAPNDMILPESVLGDYAYLSMDLIRILPTAALGDGIVRLSDRVFRKISAAKDACLAGRSRAVTAFEFSDLPYFGDADPRRSEHKVMHRAIQQEQARVFAPSPDDVPFMERVRRTLSDIGRAALSPGAILGGHVAFCCIPPAFLTAWFAGLDRSRASCAVKYRIEGHDDVLFFEYDFAEKKLWIKCRTRADEPSGAFDGWRLLDESSRVLGTIDSGGLSVAGDEVRGLGFFFLLSPGDGRLFALVASGQD